MIGTCYAFHDWLIAISPPYMMASVCQCQLLLPIGLSTPSSEREDVHYKDFKWTSFPVTPQLFPAFFSKALLLLIKWRLAMRCPPPQCPAPSHPSPPPPPQPCFRLARGDESASGPCPGWAPGPQTGLHSLGWPREPRDWARAVEAWDWGPHHTV